MTDNSITSPEPRSTRFPAESVVVMTELVLPAQANLLNNLLGGQTMHLMDIAGALSCRRHSGSEVATVAVDKLEFRHPVRVGEIITITSKMIWVGHTSMKVRIEVGSEDTTAHTSRLTNTAFFTYTALDEHGRPKTVPMLQPQTPEEQEAFDHEQSKYERRRQEQKKV